MPYIFENFSYHSDKSTIVHQEKEHKLTNLQKKLFEYFLKNPQTIINKETLMQEVWGRIVTDNTINKFISALRACVEENPKEPKVFITHFGHGISFEAMPQTLGACQQRSVHKKNKRFLLALVATILVIIVYFISTISDKANEKSATSIQLHENQHLLILPTQYDNVAIDPATQEGYQQLLQTSFKQRDKNGNILFNQSSLNNQQAIEKYWQLDKKLLVLQTKVIKNGEIYESIVNVSKGNDVVLESKISHKNLDELLNLQRQQLANFQTNSASSLDNKRLYNHQYIKALGLIKMGKTSEAQNILQQILEQDDQNYTARYQLAQLLLQKKDYTQSQAHLETLKNTQAYHLFGDEIELSLATIYSQQQHHQKAIDQLIKYLATHPELGEISKSNLKLHIADAYLALTALQNAMKFYKQAVSTIDANFHPDIYAKSLYGQAKVLLNDSNEPSIYALLEQALDYAKAANDYAYQILILDEMARILLVSNQWQKGIALKKQALEIMELTDDEQQVATGLGTLAAFLIQSGRFSEAQEINQRLKKIATKTNNSTQMLNYLHYEAVLLLNAFKFEQAKSIIQQHLQLAKNQHNIAMQLDNAFLEFELRLAQENLDGFEQEWHKRKAMIKQNGLQRYQVYLDLYLARYYKQSKNTAQAMTIIQQVSETVKANNDLKLLVDAQEQLAEIYLEDKPQKALQILQQLQQYQPDANPYLELLAKTYYKLGRKLEAIKTFTQAKLVFNQAWKAKDEKLLEQWQKEVKP